MGSHEPGRKLSFLPVAQGITYRDDGPQKPTWSSAVLLDDECEEMFNTNENNLPVTLFNSEDASTSSQMPRKELDLLDSSAHRKKSYPHTYVPLKPGKVVRRRFFSTSGDDGASSWRTTLIDSIPEPEAKTSPTEKESFKLSFDSDTQVSDPASESTNIATSSLEKHVQFGSDDKFPETMEKPPKSVRKISAPHGRKFSLQEEPQLKYEGRRISVQPEDAVLPEADLEDLDSHRSDDPRVFRRSKLRKISTANTHISISRKDGPGKLKEILSPSKFKKIYDHQPHSLFVQLDELSEGAEEWKQTARWIKYEEDLEEGSDRWGKPHVASLSFHSLLNLRRCIQSGVLLLDMNEKDLAGITFRIAEQMSIDELVDEADKSAVMRSLLLRHKRVNDNEKGFKISLKKNSSYTSLQNLSDGEKNKTQTVCVNADGKESKWSLNSAGEDYVKIDVREETYTSQDDVKKVAEDSISRRIPIGSEATAVWVGTVGYLTSPTIAFVRLAQGTVLPSVTEISIPVRFIFVLLGPSSSDLDYHEIGRSISTLMSNSSFHEIAYKAEHRKDLLSAINEFLDDSIVLPPGNWDSQALLPFDELKSKSEMIMKRKKTALEKRSKGEEVKKDEPAPETEKKKEKKEKKFDPLRKTGNFFGGLINDMKHRYPYYRSDFIDGLNVQVLAAAIFMYFAALSSAITFGGLIADKTNNKMGISETLIATAFTGILFALFAGQPMMVVGATGPLLLFDESLHNLCVNNNIDYLAVRFYTTVWLAIISTLVAMFEGSVLVKKFTRFTEDIFSSLISLIFIMEPITKLIFVFSKHPLMRDYCNAPPTPVIENDSEFALMYNDYNGTALGDENNTSIVNQTYLSNLANSVVVPAAIGKSHSIEVESQPNTALFSTLLTLGTFAIAYYLRIFRNSKFLGRSIRRALGDFGVPIAIIIMVMLDYFVPQTYTEKLSVPKGLKPSDENRGWIISLTGSDKFDLPIWVPFAACIPALMIYIIIFMETHIAELIVDKPERNLKKGSGFHMDIVVISYLNIFCGIIGAPYMCVATVRSVSHVSALTVMSTNHAPGDKPHITEVKEQRLSSLLVSVLIGVSVLMSALLRLVPLSVLFGIFLYMGISSVNGIQLFERIVLFFMPVKHHPPAVYVKKVPTMKMHLFTIIQIGCLALLWVVKSSQASLAFPFLLIMMVPLRWQLNYIFTSFELRALDGKQAELDLDDEPDFYLEAHQHG